MVHPNLRAARTDADALIGNLRGEVGEAITTWVLLRHLMHQRSIVRGDDPSAELQNPELMFLNLLINRLNNDLVAALSELSEQKIGRTNFHFAEKKLGLSLSSVQHFRKFIEKRGFRKKRNQHIAHKELPEKWLDPGMLPLHIKYVDVLKALALAVRAMKKIDCQYLGPNAPYLWAEVRKKRYKLMLPGRVAYILLPHMALPAHVGLKPEGP